LTLIQTKEVQRMTENEKQAKIKSLKTDLAFRIRLIKRQKEIVAEIKAEIEEIENEAET
jgi:hypothetical protein